jgi:acetyl-CoA C-acetyltransferase/acetyl-CoA acyltransferase 2
LKTYLVGAKRTAFGKFGGSLANLAPVELATICSRDLIRLLPVEEISQVLFANVIPSTSATLYAARHLALNLGAPITTAGKVVNRLCGSGIEVLSEAINLIKLRRANTLLCAGAENMSMVPHLVYGGRFGTKYGGLQSVDLLLETLTDQRCQTPMGITAENLAKQYQLTRQECDEYALESHLKAVKAKAFHMREIIEVSLKNINFNYDEHVRSDVDINAIQKLRPSFLKDGVVTAANASGIVDGAAACLVASEDYCLKNKLDTLAELVDYSVIGVEPSVMGIGPVPAIQSLLKNNNLKIDDIDLFEINEAFASQVLACQRELEIPLEKLNIWGGAIALGHPLGATGLRLVQTLALQLKENNLQYGIASACIGGGQGIAILLKNT